MVERSVGSASEEELAGSAALAPEAGGRGTATDAVVGWLTDFDAPAVGRARERRLDRRTLPRRVVARTRIRWSTLVAVLAGIGAAAIAVATVDPRWDGAPVPVASPSTSAPPPSATPTPVTPVPSLVPQDCGRFFSARMEKRLRSHDLRLYDRDSLADASLTLPRGRSVGTADNRLARMLAGIAETECFWLHDENPEVSGVLTAVGEGRARQLALARERLDERGLTRLEEDGGIRYFEETVGADGVPTGESHFFKGGVWFATQWYGYGPRGYSADMANSLLGRRR